MFGRLVVDRDDDRKLGSHQEQESRHYSNETVPSFDGTFAWPWRCSPPFWAHVAAAVYWRAGLTLSHYDAKAHLVVSRASSTA